MVRTLREVWRIHYARDDGQPRWRAGAELPPVGDRLQSPYDPEMHYSMKRQLEWSGYKVHITETCDDDAAHLITHVKTCPAMQPDMTSTAEIHERLAAKELLPAEHFVDSAYVDAGLLVGSRRDHGVSLEGPVRGVSSWQARAGQGYDLSRFLDRLGARAGHLPAGQGLGDPGAPSRSDRRQPAHQRPVQPRRIAGPVPPRPCAPPAKDARRSVYFHPRAEYEALNAARARMRDPAWKERYQVRAGVEGTLSQGVRAFGMRRSRYIGLAKPGSSRSAPPPR